MQFSSASSSLTSILYIHPFSSFFWPPISSSCAFLYSEQTCSQLRCPQQIKYILFWYRTWAFAGRKPSLTVSHSAARNFQKIHHRDNKIQPFDLISSWFNPAHISQPLSLLRFLLLSFYLHLGLQVPPSHITVYFQPRACQENCTPECVSGSSNCTQIQRVTWHSLITEGRSCILPQPLLLFVLLQ